MDLDVVVHASVSVVVGFLVIGSCPVFVDFLLGGILWLINILTEACPLVVAGLPGDVSFQMIVVDVPTEVYLPVIADLQGDVSFQMMLIDVSTVVSPSGCWFAGGRELPDDSNRCSDEGMVPRICRLTEGREFPDDSRRLSDGGISPSGCWFTGGRELPDDSGRRSDGGMSPSSC